MRFLSGIARAGPGLGPIGAIVFAAVFLLLVAAATLLAARGALSQSARTVTTFAADQTEVTAALALQRSRAQAQAGNYREAFRLLFLGTLLQLQEDGRLRLRRGDTNRELLRMFKDGGPDPVDRHEALARLIDEFDRAWYGHLPFSQQDYTRCLDLSSRVLARSAVRSEGGDAHEPASA